MLLLAFNAFLLTSRWALALLDPFVINIFSEILVFGSDGEFASILFLLWMNILSAYRKPFEDLVTVLLFVFFGTVLDD